MSWREEPMNSQLKARALVGDWFISSNYERLVGRVINIVYAGYKIQLPDKSEKIIHPENSKIVDISPEEYEQKRKEWLERMEADKIEKERLRVEDAKRATELEEKQSKCQHVNVKENTKILSTYCDIDEISCDGCGKLLSRGWSTPYDNDPKSHISDWPWYVRYCQQKYNGFTPDQSGYEIVSQIGAI